jgi:hypothetical protein
MPASDAMRQWAKQAIDYEVQMQAQTPLATKAIWDLKEALGEGGDVPGWVESELESVVDATAVALQATAPTESQAVLQPEQWAEEEYDEEDFVEVFEAETAELQALLDRVTPILQDSSEEVTPEEMDILIEALQKQLITADVVEEGKPEVEITGEGITVEILENK